jgi:hypothetical protein
MGVGINCLWIKFLKYLFWLFILFSLTLSNVWILPLINITWNTRSRNSSLGIETCCGLEGRVSISGRSKILFFSITSKPVLGLTQPLIQWIMRAVSLGVKCLDLKLTTHLHVLPRSTVFFLFCGVGLSLLGTAATSGLLYKSQMIDEGDCGAIGGMKIGRGNRSTRRKPGAIGGMKIGRGNRSTRRKPVPAPLVHHKSHMTRPVLETGPPRWEASD